MSITMKSLAATTATMTGCSQVDCARILRAALDTIKRAKTDVRLRGFGTFSISKHAARQAWNPSTGEPVQIQACNRVRFKPCPDYKAAVNE